MPFTSVDQILNYAFVAESRKINPDIAYELISRSTSPDSLSQEEFIADGIMLKARAMRSLPMLQRHAIALYYRRPVDPGLQEMVEYSLYVLADGIQRERKNRIDSFFIIDMAREWSPYNRSHHTLEWWSDHLNKPLGTVKSWASDKRPDQKSVKYLIQLWYDAAIQELEYVYREAGVYEAA